MISTFHKYFAPKPPPPFPPKKFQCVLFSCQLKSHSVIFDIPTSLKLKYNSPRHKEANNKGSLQANVKFPDSCCNLLNTNQDA